MPTYDDGSCNTLTADWHSPAIAVRTSNTSANGSGVTEECAHTIDTTGPEAVALPATVLKVRGGADTYMKRDGAVGTAGKGALSSEEVAFTVAATQDQTLFQPVDFRHGEVGEGDDATQTLQSKSTGGYSLNYMPGATDGYVVRRLTPRECERLQGFPDDWTRIPYRGKPAEECPDGPRYKAIGNSMAVPVMRWIGERIQMVDDLLREETE